MGEDVERRQFTREDRMRYRDKVRRCLDVFARMLKERPFDVDRPMVGIEIEFDLVNEGGDPAMRNAEALESIADPNFQTELGQFNPELNVAPRHLPDGGVSAFQDGLRASLNNAEERSNRVGAHMLTIGILPTLGNEHMTADVLSANPRYSLLSEQILAAGGEDIEIAIDGIERLRLTADSIAPEAACTSTQLHLPVSPERFADFWTAAQAISGVQIAVGANSPFLFGRALWRESRIALFEQSTDTRSDELKVQGVRPRVWFGERWITSVFDLFEDNVRYFPALLPIVDDEDPEAVVEREGIPTLGELRRHNGTIYRWNRPIYDIVAGVPHLRVENRVLSAGPTVIGTRANTGRVANGYRQVLSPTDDAS